MGGRREGIKLSFHVINVFDRGTLNEKQVDGNFRGGGEFIISPPPTSS